MAGFMLQLLLVNIAQLFSSWMRVCFPSLPQLKPPVLVAIRT